MKIITQKFNEISKTIINSLKNKEIKSIIGRVRLKFTYKEINDYVQIIFAHSQTQKSFKSIYKKSKFKIKYSCFMSNIQLFSKLFRFLFYKLNEKLSIKPSKLLNMVDTTLIEEKKLNFINQHDWDSGRVTTRINKKNKIKTYTCGSKGLVFLNRFGQIYSANLLNINYSDQNILKDFSFYIKELNGILLADRGFSNKAVRERLNHIKTSVFETNKPLCRLISPYNVKQNIKLTDKERKLYKRRWKIETVFQNIKHNYSENKLNLTGKYNNLTKGAKFYSTLINFNLSTI
jgi:hypothetical protein